MKHPNELDASGYDDIEKMSVQNMKYLNELDKTRKNQQPRKSKSEAA